MGTSLSVPDGRRRRPTRQRHWLYAAQLPTGGHGRSGWRYDNALKLSGETNICVDSETQALQVDNNCATPLLVSSVVDGKLQISNLAGGIEAGEQSRLLVLGELQGSLSVGEGCGNLEGRFFPDPFLSVCENPLALSLRFVDGVLSSSQAALDAEGNLLDVTELGAGPHDLYYSGGCTIQGVVDLFEDEQGNPVAFVSAESVVATDLSDLKPGDRFVVDGGDGQFYEVEVRFVRGNEAKLEFFMPPPKQQLAMES